MNESPVTLVEPSPETCRRIIVENDAHRLTAASACQKGVAHYDIHYRQTAEAEAILRRNGEDLPIVDRAGKRREHFRVALAHFLTLAHEANESGDNERRRLTRAWLEYTLAACADTVPPDEYATALGEAMMIDTTFENFEARRSARQANARNGTQPDEANASTVVPFPDRKAS